MKAGKVVIAISEDFYRPTDVVNLWGNPTKAKNELGWKYKVELKEGIHLAYDDFLNDPMK